MGKFVGSALSYAIKSWREADPGVPFWVKLQGCIRLMAGIEQLQKMAKFEHDALQNSIKKAKNASYPLRISECCKKLPESFAKNLDLSKIPELASSAKSIGYDLGFKYYVCEKCGQFWYEKITTID